MSRFTAGQKVWYRSPYTTPGDRWRQVEVIEVVEPTEENKLQVPNVRLMCEKGHPVSNTPGIFILPHEDHEGVRFPAVSVPLNDHTVCTVRFPQAAPEGHPLQFTYEAENAYTGAKNTFVLWVKQEHREDGKAAVLGSLTWEVTPEQVAAKCRVGCTNELCGSEGIINDLKAIARPSATATAYLQEALAGGDTLDAAVEGLYGVLKKQAESIFEHAEQDIMEQMEEAIGGQGDEPIPSGIHEVLRRLGIDPAARNVQVITLGGDGDDGAKGGPESKA